MSHTSCPNGHGMWDGDGKPVRWVFRVGFLKEYQEKHPDHILDDKSHLGEDYPYQIYDCAYDVKGEEIDCWYCDECGGLSVFVDISYYGFVPMENIPYVKPEDVSDWEEYIAMNEEDFEDFEEFYSGMRPYDAVCRYDFKYKFWVSPDKKQIYGFDKEGKCCYAYKRTHYSETSPDFEIGFGSNGQYTPYRPYEYYDGKYDITVKINQNAELKDGRNVLIEKVITPGKLYLGIEKECESSEAFYITHDEISYVYEED